MSKHILYLASGSGSRFGGNKLLHPLEGKPMYRHGLDALRSAIADRPDCTLTVVSRYEEIRRTALELGLRAVDSPESARGISHTIRAGLASLGRLEEGDFVLFAAADQPRLSAHSVRRLLDAARPGVECACLSWEGRPGNPALFSAQLAPELMELEGDTGGRAVLNRHSCLSVPAQSGEELQDMDFRP